MQLPSKAAPFYLPVSPGCNERPSSWECMGTGIVLGYNVLA